MKKLVALTVSHIAVGLIGFAAGIYVLPILTAPPAPTTEEVRAAAQETLYSAEFQRDLKDSDAVHWGDGIVSITHDSISLEGAVSPGPDYKLYLSPTFVETEEDFTRLKDTMVRVGDVKTFENFIVSVPSSIDPGSFNSVIVWCERFGQFITAAKYQ